MVYCIVYPIRSNGYLRLTMKLCILYHRLCRLIAGGLLAVLERVGRKVTRPVNFFAGNQEMAKTLTIFTGLLGPAENLFSAEWVKPVAGKNHLWAFPVFILKAGTPAKVLTASRSSIRLRKELTVICICKMGFLCFRRQSREMSKLLRASAAYHPASRLLHPQIVFR
jgi:hypothetical protein